MFRTWTWAPHVLAIDGYGIKVKTCSRQSKPGIGESPAGTIDSRAGAGNGDAWRDPGIPTERRAMASGILVLGSDQEELETCQRELASLGYRPIVTTDREKARALLKSERPALLFSDILWLSETAGSE